MNIELERSADRPINVVLVAGGRWHDIDFARVELLKILGEDDRVRVQVFSDYADGNAIQRADFLITYTCDVIPDGDTQRMLRDYVERGGRWFALHGTNSILTFLESGKVDAPDHAPLFMDTLGTAFVAHPPIGPYRVEITNPDHPLTRDIDPFETVDELYLSRTVADIETLLHCEFEGAAPAFVADQWERTRQPVLYVRSLGQGAVLYLTLGHCRGHYDMRPLVDYFPEIQRGSWDLPIFYELVRRGIAWAKRSLG